MTLRALARPIAYRSGALGAYYARRNAATLTVLMFHRVLPEREMRHLGADPLYTVAPQFLADCIAFLRDHYTIVSLDDVLLSRARKKRLPRNSVLITFDDGWFDNVLYAAPALKGVPWLMFASTDAISQPDCWWQERGGA